MRWCNNLIETKCLFNALFRSFGSAADLDLAGRYENLKLRYMGRSVMWLLRPYSQARPRRTEEKSTLCSNIYSAVQTASTESRGDFIIAQDSGFPLFSLFEHFSVVFAGPPVLESYFDRKWPIEP